MPSTSAHNRVFNEVPNPGPGLPILLWGVIRRLCRFSYRDIAIFEWGPKVTKKTLVADLIACATVAVVLIPQGMAYGVLAGLDPVYGLISSTIPLMCYSLFTLSSQVAFGPVAPTAILLAATIQQTTGAQPRTPEFLHYHLVLSFLSGIFLLFCGFLRVGAFASRLLSWPVTSGFSTGAAFLIIATQISELLRLDLTPVGGKSDSCLPQLWRSLLSLPSIHWPSAAVGVPCLLVLLFWKDVSFPSSWCRCFLRGASGQSASSGVSAASGSDQQQQQQTQSQAHAQGQQQAQASAASSPSSNSGGRWKIPKKTPVPLILVLFGVGVSWAANLQGAGVKVVGPIPASLPPPQFPLSTSNSAAAWADVKLLMGPAALVGTISFIQTVTLALLFGQQKRKREGKEEERIEPNGELFALGISSVVGSFFSCFTCAGSFTRSAIQSEAGAKTPLVTFLSGALLLAFLYSLIGAFSQLPITVLAAVVLSSTRPLISLGDATFLWRVKPSDFASFAVTFVGVVLLGISDGLLLGIGFSLATVLYRSFLPRLVALGRLPGTDVFVALERFPETRPVAGVVVLRLDSALHFGNVQSVTKRLFEELERKQQPPSSQPSSFGSMQQLQAQPAGSLQQQHQRPGGATLELSLASPGPNAPFDLAVSPAAAATSPVPTAVPTVTTNAAVSRSVYALATFDNSAGGEVESLLAGSRGIHSSSSSSSSSSSGGAGIAANSRGVGGSSFFGGKATALGGMIPAEAADEEAEDIARSASVGRALQPHIQEGAAAVEAGASHGVSTSNSNNNNNSNNNAGVSSSSSWHVVAPPPSQPPLAPALAPVPLRAVILDASRVVDIDATACRELQTVIEAYRKKGPKLLIAGLPGPVRDVLEKFVSASSSSSSSSSSFDPSTIRFLNVMAAIAFLFEKEREQENWERITTDLATIASNSAASNSDDSSSMTGGGGRGARGDFGTGIHHRGGGGGGSFPIGLRSRNVASSASASDAGSSGAAGPSSVSVGGAGAAPVVLSAASGSVGASLAGPLSQPLPAPPGLVFSTGSYLAAENETTLGKKSLLSAAANANGGSGGASV